MLAALLTTGSFGICPATFASADIAIIAALGVGAGGGIAAFHPFP